MAGRGNWDGVTGWTYTRLEWNAFGASYPPQSDASAAIWGEWFFEAAAGGSHELATGNLDAGAPTLASPALTQTHALQTVALAVAAPTLDTALLTIVHVLLCTALDTAAPVLDQATLTQTHALATDDLARGAPTLDSPALTQVHMLAADGLSTGAPALDSPLLGQMHVLGADALDAGAPELGSLELTVGAAPARGGGLPWRETPKARKFREARTRAEREAEEELRRLLRQAYRKAQEIDDERAEPIVAAAKAAVSAPTPEIAERVETFAAELAALADVQQAVALMREVLRLRRQVEVIEATERAALEDEEDAMMLIAMAA